MRYVSGNSSRSLLWRILGRNDTHGEQTLKQCHSEGGRGSEALPGFGSASRVRFEEPALGPIRDQHGGAFSRMMDALRLEHS